MINEILGDIITFYPVKRFLPEPDRPLLIWTTHDTIVSGVFLSYFVTSDGMYLANKSIRGWAYNGR